MVAQGPIWHREIRGSGDGGESADRSQAFRLVFQLMGSDSVAAMKAHAAAALLFPGLIQNTDGATLVLHNLSRRQLAARRWEWIGDYKDPERVDRARRLNVGQVRLGWQTGGGTVRIFSTPYGVTRYGRPGETPPDFKGSLNVDKSGKAQGVDVQIPALRFTISVKLAGAAVDAAYIKLLNSLTATTNDATFYGFAPGEVLFLSSTGTVPLTPDEVDVEASFTFAVEANADAGPPNNTLAFGDVVGVAKGGHDYLWIQYVDQPDDTATPKRMVTVPRAVHVAQIYAPEDFSKLGIGDGAP